MIPKHSVKENQLVQRWAQIQLLTRYHGLDSLISDKKLPGCYIMWVFLLKSEVLIDLCVMRHFTTFASVFLLILHLSCLILQTNLRLDFVLVTDTGIGVIKDINNKPMQFIHKITLFQANMIHMYFRVFIIKMWVKL